MADALAQLTAGDDSFHCSIDRDNRQIIVGTQRETELQDALTRLDREFHVKVNVGPPQVSYRETITQAIESDCVHKLEIGGPDAFVRLRVRFEPLPTGEDISFGSVPNSDKLIREILPIVEKGLKAAMQSGPVAGYPMIGVRATLMDAERQNADAPLATFCIAAGACYREAVPKARPTLLEPIMIADVITPDAYMGDVIGDLNSRRGLIDSMETQGEERVITAEVPLANLLGYAKSLSALTRGEGSFTTKFSRWEPPLLPFEGPPFRPAIGMRA
ncbi:translation factor GTPase family protein [Hypericibacter terrae]